MPHLTVVLARLQEVPVLPVLAKADSMTGPELERFRQHVRSEMYRVRVLQPAVSICF